MDAQHSPDSAGDPLPRQSDAESAAPSAEPAVAAPKGKDTLCAYPWKWLYVNPAGRPQPCCKFSEPLLKDGVPMTVYDHTLEEIWSSDAMRRIRLNMVEGKGERGCGVCYRDEAAYGFSFRTQVNEAFEAGFLNEEWESDKDLKEQARSSAGEVPNLPIAYQLDFGNLCNLKCRMCNGWYSSRINLDPVHRQWAGMPPAEQASRLPGDGHWFGREDIIFHQLLQDPSQLRFLNLAGGEPLLSKQVGDLLHGLVELGAAKNVSLEFTTNATTVSAWWLDLLKEFKSVCIFISIDGHEAIYEYVRYPAKWETLTQNVAYLRQLLPQASFWASVTVQSYNVLTITDLYRWLDSVGIKFAPYVLDEPRHLKAVMLPPNARRLAAERLRQYAARDCLPENRQWVQDLAAGLEPDRDSFSQPLMRDFMLFTNDLDQSRGQDFRETHAELVQLLAESGFTWTTEMLFAGKPEGRVPLL